MKVFENKYFPSNINISKSINAKSFFVLVGAITVLVNAIFKNFECVQNFFKKAVNAGLDNKKRLISDQTHEHQVREKEESEESEAKEYENYLNFFKDCYLNNWGLPNSRYYGDNESTEDSAKFLANTFKMNFVKYKAPDIFENPRLFTESVLSQIDHAKKTEKKVFFYIENGDLIFKERNGVKGTIMGLTGSREKDYNFCLHFQNTPDLEDDVIRRFPNRFLLED